jgi:hypothetical protein
MAKARTDLNQMAVSIERYLREIREMIVALWTASLHAAD